MGYRNSIMSMPKDFYNSIKDKSYEELASLYCDKDDEYDTFTIHTLSDIDKTKDIYSLGKYCDDVTSDFTSQLFSKFDITGGDGECDLLDKEGFAAIINHYSDIIIGMYGSLIEKSSIEKYREHMTRYLREWAGGRGGPYDLEHGDEVTNSWFYEYTIFELVRLYKTFDYDNNILIYYGG